MTENALDKPFVAAQLHLMGGLTERFFKLLGAIHTSGSISQAARDASMSYKGAWDMLERANNLSPRALVTTEVGGRHGGGARLTPAGEKLLELFETIRQKHQVFLAGLNNTLLEDSEFRGLFRRLAIMASARNQLLARIAMTLNTETEAEVTLRTKGGDELVAEVSRNSANSVDLQPGKEVIALIKAPQLFLVSEFSGYRFSARNQLTGTVGRIHGGSVDSEVVVYLPAGDSIAVTMTSESLKGMDLKVGDPATALFKSSSITIALFEP